MGDGRGIIALLPSQIGPRTRALGTGEFAGGPRVEPFLLPGGFEARGHLLDLRQVFHPISGGLELRQLRLQHFVRAAHSGIEAHETILHLAAH